MENKNLRAFAKEHGVKLWEIAALWGISEPTMTRKMRQEFDGKAQESFMRAVERIQVMHDEKEADADV